MNGKPNNIIRIPTSPDGNFFKYWFEFLKPFHKLTDREIDIISSFVRERYLLSKVIKDSNLLDKITMSEDTKRKIRIECNIKPSHFQIVFSRLKKKKVIIDDRINPRYIPNIVEDSGNFQLLLLFDFDDESKNIEAGS